MYIAFALAIVVAISIVVSRKLTLRRDRKRRLSAPGLSLDRPLEVQSYGEVDRFERDVRCPMCGKGRLTKLGEGTVTGPAGVLSAVRTECLRCEERVALYFDVGSVPN